MFAKSAAVSVICVLCACPATAQTDFSGLRLRFGQITYVTDPDGTQISGRLTALSPSMLSINGHVYRPVPGLKIERRARPSLGWGPGARIGRTIGRLFKPATRGHATTAHDTDRAAR
jgi:hypothetical protein